MADQGFSANPQGEEGVNLLFDQVSAKLHENEEILVCGRRGGGGGGRPLRPWILRCYLINLQEKITSEILHNLIILLHGLLVQWIPFTTGKKMQNKKELLQDTTRSVPTAVYAVNECTPSLSCRVGGGVYNILTWLGYPPPQSWPGYPQKRHGTSGSIIGWRWVSPRKGMGPVEVLWAGNGVPPHSLLTNACENITLPSSFECGRYKI